MFGQYWQILAHIISGTKHDRDKSISDREKRSMGSITIRSKRGTKWGQAIIH